MQSVPSDYVRWARWNKAERMTSTAIYFVFLFRKTRVDELRIVNSHQYPATLSLKLRFYVIWFLKGNKAQLGGLCAEKK